MRLLDTGDKFGLVSCIVGTIILFIPLPTLIAIYFWLISGNIVVAFGIIAIVNDSKVGIGGIILGALTIFVGVMYIVLFPIL